MTSAPMIVLGAGPDQVPLVRALAERAIPTVVIDYLTDPPGAAWAARHIRASWSDRDAVREVAASTGAWGIASLGIDAAQVIAASVADELGLVFQVTGAQAFSTTNKLVMKRTLVEYGIPTAPFATVEGSNVAADLELPVVVKPVDGSGSQGVALANSPRERRDAIATAIGCSPSGQALVEKFMSGLEVTIDAVVREGQATVVAVSENQTAWRRNETSIVATSYSPPLHASLQTSATALCQEVVQAFGLGNTPLLVQAKAQGQELVVLELTARLAGGFKSELVRRATGVDLVQRYLDTLRSEPSPLPPPTRDTFVAINHLNSLAGTFGRVTAVDDLLRSGLIDDYLPSKATGAQMDGAFNARGRVGAFIVSGHSADEVAQRTTQARRLLTVRGSHEEDLTLRVM